MGQLSRNAEIPGLHGEVLSGSRQVRERTTDGLQSVDRAGRGAEAVRRQPHPRERHEGGREYGFRDQHLYPGNTHQDLADGFLSDRAGADDAIHRRELAAVRPDHRRSRGVGKPAPRGKVCEGGNRPRAAAGRSPVWSDGLLRRSISRIDFTYCPENRGYDGLWLAMLSTIVASARRWKKRSNECPAMISASTEACGERIHRMPTSRCSTCCAA